MLLPWEPRRGLARERGGAAGDSACAHLGTQEVTPATVDSVKMQTHCAQGPSSGRGLHPSHPLGPGLPTEGKALVCLFLLLSLVGA